jgi:hypothetical protein
MTPDPEPLNFPFPEQLPTEAPEPDDPEDPSAEDQVDQAVDHEAQYRLWLRAIIPLLQLRSHESDPSGRVQLALDLAQIAACERICRLMRSDLPASGPGG